MRLRIKASTHEINQEEIPLVDLRAKGSEGLDDSCHGSAKVFELPGTLLGNRFQGEQLIKVRVDKGPLIVKA